MNREQERPIEARYLHFGGMTWPNPHALEEMAWRLRYGQPTKVDLLLAASVVGAYRQLVEDSQRERNAKISGISRAASAALPGTGTDRTDK